MADIFNKKSAQIVTPITADHCQLTIGTALVADAIQFSASYNQGVTHRRAIGNKSVMIYTSMPRGQISVARLLADDIKEVLNSEIFTCKGGQIRFQGSSCPENGPIKPVTYTCKGCIASSYSISASADDQTVMDNLVIDFVEMSID